MSDMERIKMEEKKVEEEKKKRPLIPKSAIMRLLAELVKSYTNCAQLITQHTFVAGQSELVAEVHFLLVLYNGRTWYCIMENMRSIWGGAWSVSRDSTVQ